MIILLIVAALFLVGAVLNVIDGVYIEAVGGFAISLFTIVIYILSKYEKRKNYEFIEWLYKNYDEIIKGEATYQGIRITPETELKQYQVCLSFLIISTKMNSRYFIREYHITQIISLLYSIITFIFGWWGLPWGPIYTVQVILSNIKGGKNITVQELLSQLKQIENN